MTETLEGKVALVTGAGRGIGMATARKLAREGAVVVGADVDHDGLARLVAELGEAHFKPFVADLLADRAPEHLAAFALDNGGKVDIVANAAGFNWDSPVAETTDDQWDALVRILVTTPFRIARALVPHFKAQADREDARGGQPTYRKVVSVAALEAASGRPGSANYAAANAALIGLSNSFAREWARMRVCANAIAFGPVQTRLLQPSGAANRLHVGGYQVAAGVPHAVAHRLGRDLAAQDGDTEAELYDVKRGFAGFWPLSIAEAAESIFYFCSPASDRVSGTMHAVGTPRRV